MVGSRINKLDPAPRASPKALHMSALNNAANLASKAGGKADSEYIKAQGTDTYMRRMDWGYTPEKEDTPRPVGHPS